MRYIMLAALLLLSSAFAMAQPDPDHPQPDPRFMEPLMILRNLDQLPPLVKTTPYGIFLVCHGVVVKYDPVTGEEKGTLELFGPAPQWSDERLQDFSEGVVFLLERVRRVLQPSLETDGKNLLILIGGQLFCLDMDACKLRYTLVVFQPDIMQEFIDHARSETSLRAASNRLFPPAQLQVVGKSAVLLRDNQMVMVNLEDGTVLSRRTLPARLTASLTPAPKTGPFAEKPVPGLADGKPYLAVGRLSDQGNGTWDFQDERGGDMLLRGAAVARLTALPEITRTRVIVQGIYHAPAKATGNPGVLDLQHFAQLTVLQP